MPPILTESVIVAVIALIGVLAGQSSERRTGRRDYELARVGADVAGLTALVDKLQAQVQGLERSLARAEVRAEEATRARAEAEARTWHALEYARSALTWGRALVPMVADIESVPDEPVVPDEIGDAL